MKLGEVIEIMGLILLVTLCIPVFMINGLWDFIDKIIHGDKDGKN